MSSGERELERDPAAATETPHSTSDLGALFVTFLLFASSFGLASAEDDGPAPHPSPTPTTTESAALDPDDPLILLEQLTIAPEADGGGYDRNAFKHWVDADRDGCDARQEVLIAEATGAVQAAADRGCPVTSGEWVSIYDGVVVTDPRRLDIDHMVPLKEAWESTAASWADEDREAYANDLDEADALLAVTASTNRSKSDRDPAQWKPPDEETWCDYATAWIRVKLKWSLNADEDEVASLREMLATC